MKIKLPIGCCCNDDKHSINCKVLYLDILNFPPNVWWICSHTCNNLQPDDTNMSAMLSVGSYSLELSDMNLFYVTTIHYSNWLIGSINHNSRHIPDRSSYFSSKEGAGFIQHKRSNAKCSLICQIFEWVLFKMLLN